MSTCLSFNACGTHFPYFWNFSHGFYTLTNCYSGRTKFFYQYLLWLGSVFIWMLLATPANPRLQTFLLCQDVQIEIATFKLTKPYLTCSNHWRMFTISFY
jgi:hypothetical protein